MKNKYRNDFIRIYGTERYAISDGEDSFVKLLQPATHTLNLFELRGRQRSPGSNQEHHGLHGSEHFKNS